MTAQDIIDQIKVLPPEQKVQVIVFIRQLDAESAPVAAASEVDQAKLGVISEKIFDRYDDLFRKLAQ